MELGQELLRTVQYVITGAMKSGDAGVFGRIKEFNAATDYIATAAETFTGNPVIDQLMAVMQETGVGYDATDTIAELDLSDITNGIGHDVALLLAKVGESGDQVKIFLYELAKAVIEAAGGGLFGSGNRVTADEARFLETLRGILALN